MLILYAVFFAVIGVSLGIAIGTISGNLFSNLIVKNNSKTLKYSSILVCWIFMFLLIITMEYYGIYREFSESFLGGVLTTFTLKVISTLK